MHRRSFIGSCVSGTVAATIATAVPAAARSKSQTSRSKSLEAGPAEAILALKAAKQLEITGNHHELAKSYHSDALLVEPGTLKPNIGRAAIVTTLSNKAKDHKLVYFHYRQPQVVVVGNSALVVSNYEAAYDTGDGKPVEYTGKSSSVVLLGPKPPLIAQDVMVPNISAGGYGPMGRALGPTRFGIYPLRALGPVPTAATSAGGGESDVLFAKVRKIHEAWVSGDTTAVLKHANKTGVFLIGDYSPFYVSGIDDVTEHFAEFFKTSSVNFVHEMDVTVRIWGDTAAVAFSFDLDYTINGINRRSPGRGVYTFARTGSDSPGPQPRNAVSGRGANSFASGGSSGRQASAPTWAMASCSASHLVDRTIGDPYPVPNT
jgi:ketosteroid isomerase-like protein